MMRFVFILLVFLAFPAYAQESAPFCDALTKEETYTGWESYRLLEQGKDGWLFRTENDYKPVAIPEDKELARLKKFSDRLQEEGTVLVLAIVPSRGVMGAAHSLSANYDPKTLMQQYRDLAKRLGDAGLNAAFIDDYQDSRDFFYKRDHHWTPAGAGAMAKVVAETLKTQDIDLPRKKFVTEQDVLVDHEGIFERLVSVACKIKPERQKIQTYRTYSPEDQSNLFGDSDTPPVVLIGTSNSVTDSSHANFDGFLKEALSADVDNTSVASGGADTAMLQWLNRKIDRKNMPKVVVWEFPVYEDFYSKNFVRQSIAGFEGACKKPVVTTTTNVTAPFMDIFKDLSGHDIKGGDYYFHIRFANPFMKNFRLVMQWKDGEGNYFNFERPRAYEPDGIYFVNIEYDRAALDAVSLQFSEIPDGKVTVDICKR